MLKSKAKKSGLAGMQGVGLRLRLSVNAKQIGQAGVGLC